ncbi:MAG: hypothetical protein EOO66_15935, partial [Methylobacterium sp.]
MPEEAARLEDTPGAGRPRKAVRRWTRRCLWTAAALLVVLGIGLGAGVMRLAYGPLQIDGLSARVSAALADRIGPGWRIDLRDSTLEL